MKNCLTSWGWWPINAVAQSLGIALTLSLTLLAFPGQVDAEQNPLGRSTTGDVGDVLEYVLPSAALVTSIVKRDYEGAKQFGVGLALTLGTNYALKETISKERPDGRDDESFPSAHTSVSFHAAGYLHERYGLKWALPVYVAATFVGYSRVYDDRHDELDVLAGALIGYGIARLFTTSYEGVIVTPEFAEDYVGLRFTINP